MRTVDPPRLAKEWLIKSCNQKDRCIFSYAPRYVYQEFIKGFDEEKEDDDE
jgi:hypothetical protein